MLAAPWGGTLATVPSSIFNSACCTPSPETSRVIEGFSSFLRSCHLVYIDDALLSFLHIASAACNSFRIMFSDILPDVTGFRQSRGVNNCERTSSMRDNVCANKVFLYPVGPIRRMLDLLNSMSPGCLSENPFDVVVHCDREFFSWMRPVNDSSHQEKTRGRMYNHYKRIFLNKQPATSS